MCKEQAPQITYIYMRVCVCVYIYVCCGYIHTYIYKTLLTQNTGAGPSQAGDAAHRHA